MTGPDTSGPPSGPRINLNLRLPDVRMFERIRREAAAWSAGTKGVSASPLSTGQREDNYRRQNTTTRLTPRQRRRADHKANRAAVRA